LALKVEQAGLAFWWVGRELLKSVRAGGGSFWKAHWGVRFWIGLKDSVLIRMLHATNLELFRTRGIRLFN
jgi:hypothetical protein